MNAVSPEWLELGDAEKRDFRTRTWIPLRRSQQYVSENRFGYEGYRKDIELIEPVVIFIQQRSTCEDLNWHGVNKSGVDRAWSDEKGFRPPGAFYNHHDEMVGFYPVLRQSFDTGERLQWHLSQEIEFSLGLLRREDSWVIPEEDYIEVVRLKRDSEGNPELLEIRAEHLRDYLCGRKAALLLTGFRYRELVEEKLDVIPWETDQERNFANGEWRGFKRTILEGGQRVGSSTAVLRMWRESVDPADDVPIMPHPTMEPAARSEEQVIHHQGKHLEYACGKIWWKQWVEPGSISPRVANDEVEPRVPFIVENQSSETLAGKALGEYRGWLWFRSEVCPALLQREASFLKWHTVETGSIGPAKNLPVHFGLNSIGLVNALGYKIAELPEWAQRIWAAFNVGPEGGLSVELHASQNLAAPANTVAPEVILWNNLQAVQQLFEQRMARTLFTELPTERDFFRTIHRFYDASFEQVCHLAKELVRTVVERMELDAVNALLGSKVNTVKKESRSIKRLETWLNEHGENGREIMGPLAGINDLRQGDAHAGEATAKSGLAIFGIPNDADNYQKMNLHIIGSVAWTLGWVAKTIDEKGALA